MSVPPIPYATSPLNPADANHMQLLVIFSWIWGGIVALFSSIFLIHVAMGVALITRGVPNLPAAGAGPANVQPFPASAMGWIFLIMGSAAVLFGWTIGALNFYSAYSLNKRRRRILSLVVAALNCLLVPIGTALGVFTLIVLLRPTVIQEYLSEAK